MTNRRNCASLAGMTCEARTRDAGIVPSLKGLTDCLFSSPGTDVPGYDCYALRAENPRYTSTLLDFGFEFGWAFGHMLEFFGGMDLGRRHQRDCSGDHDCPGEHEMIDAFAQHDRS